MNKAIVITVGIIFSIGLLLIGFVISFHLINEKDQTVFSQRTAVTEIEKTVVLTEVEKDGQLESLPNAEAEAARWNEVAKDFIAMYSEYSYDSSNIHKVKEKSNEEVTVFAHDFKTSLKTSIEYSVDNETTEITEMRLVGYEQVNADRSAIFHAMSIFISYVDDEVSLTEANEYLGEIPFATDKEGLYEMEFNGKKYDFELDFSDGLNMLVYRIVE